MSDIDCHSINQAVSRLEAWLETLRGPKGELGYGGPVAHWWRQCLLYTGPACDWRYEGIVDGYLALWERTGEARWLAKARRAGDDLVKAQLPDGHFPASAFEINPASGGTPGEAACDLALLNLAKAMREKSLDGWQDYFKASVHNLKSYFIQKLWDPVARAFRDHPRLACFVPNKAATLAQAFFCWSELSGEAEWAEHYALPTMQEVLQHQQQGGLLDGAICQNSFGARQVHKFFPFYIARCLPGLLAAYHWSGQECFGEAARRAGEFLKRARQADGAFPQVLYPGRRANRWPQWRAAAADILWALEDAEKVGVSFDPQPTMSWLMAGQDDSGGFQTGLGFIAQAGGRPGGTPELRDLLHVAGWADKAFRYLASKTSRARLPNTKMEVWQDQAIFRGERLSLLETDERLEARCQGKTAYLWVKGEAWTREAQPIFWLH